jgi:hypothetical protein
VNAPELSVVGWVISKDASPKVFAGIEKLLRAGVPLLTTKGAVIVAAVYLALVALTALMFEVPIPTMVIVFPTMVATAVFELV